MVLNPECVHARQVRLSSVEERAMKAERERKETAAALERQLTAARAEVLDWRRELAAAEAERDRLMTDKKALAKRASSGSLYAGYGGTPKARGIASCTRQAIYSSSIFACRRNGIVQLIMLRVYLPIVCCTPMRQLQGASNSFKRLPPVMGEHSCTLKLLTKQLTFIYWQCRGWQLARHS